MEKIDHSSIPISYTTSMDSSSSNREEILRENDKWRVKSLQEEEEVITIQQGKHSLSQK